eukprot:Skav218696  [mRNA]  locus=scaffold1346:187666:190316:- [translate_table: standard]
MDDIFSSAMDGSFLAQRLPAELPGFSQTNGAHEVPWPLPRSGGRGAATAAFHRLYGSFDSGGRALTSVH